MSEKWKELNNAELILYNMPKGKECEVLEYFAETDYKLFLRLINIHLEGSPFSRRKVILHYKEENLEELEKSKPGIVKYLYDSIKYMEGLSENGKKSSEYLRNLYATRKKEFLHSSGKPMTFFTVSKKFPIVTKEDCFEVADFFMRSGLSATAFCAQYEIDNISGFREAMSRVALNDENFKSYYEALSSNKKTAYLALCKKTIEEVANGSMSVEAVIENHAESRTFEKLLPLADSLFENKQVIDQFVLNVLSYYKTRLDSYNDSINPDEIKKMLSYKEISFLIGADTFTDMKKGMCINIGQLLRERLTPYENHLKSITLHRVFGGLPKSLGSKLKTYATPFNKKNYLASNTQIILLNGSTTPVTRDVIDMAECFIKQHGLFKCYSTINRLNRSILNGFLDYSAETEAYKKYLQEQIVFDLSECETLEEYLLYQSCLQ